jgi:phosphate starvation-inducible PhoH-like protein
VLARHDGSVARVAKDWGTDFDSPGKLRELTGRNLVLASRGYRLDQDAFAAHYTREYFRQTAEAIRRHDIVFGIGPAGTGKTYIAVALAVRALKNREVKRIIITRPAVEAGENLGFLPGDLQEKLDPYLRPIYDALQDMIPPEKLKYYQETRAIEIAPLAYMRGRTLHDAFVLLDEAQNTTAEQIKMFLTRMGPNSKVIITGDQTQVDLPTRQKSGLSEALRVLNDVKGIGVVRLSGSDVIRHKLVKAIIAAYETSEDEKEKLRQDAHGK